MDGIEITIAKPEPEPEPAQSGSSPPLHPPRARAVALTGAESIIINADEIEANDSDKSFMELMLNHPVTMALFADINPDAAFGPTTDSAPPRPYTTEDVVVVKAALRTLGWKLKNKRMICAKDAERNEAALLGFISSGIQSIERFPSEYGRVTKSIAIPGPIGAMATMAVTSWKSGDAQAASNDNGSWKGALTSAVLPVVNIFGGLAIGVLWLLATTRYRNMVQAHMSLALSIYWTAKKDVVPAEPVTVPEPPEEVDEAAALTAAAEGEGEGGAGGQGGEGEGEEEGTPVAQPLSPQEKQSVIDAYKKQQQMAAVKAAKEAAKKTV